MSNLEEYLKLLSKQEEVKEEKITIKRNATLEKIIKSYELWLAQQDEEYRLYNSKDEYNRTLKTYSRKKYTSKDIEDFSLELLKYQNRKCFENTGLFLSALINHSKDKEFTIITEHLDKKINLIGYENEKIANIKGNAGNYVGRHNKGTITVGENAGNEVGEYNEGTITVGGDAGNYVGWNNKGTIRVGDARNYVGLYNEGTITVGGDAGNYVGRHNKGTITVGGDAGNYVGEYNKGTMKVGENAGNDVGWVNKGTIKINGKIKSLSKYASGKIYQGGKLIRRKK